MIGQIGAGTRIIGLLSLPVPLNSGSFVPLGEIAHTELVNGYNQVNRENGKRHTLWVVLLTAVMMVVELVAGVVYGSMALLADGLHMASHATALGIAVFAYVIARRLATDRLMDPQTISFDQALIVAVVGLAVNGFSAWILISTPHAHEHGIYAAELALVSHEPKSPAHYKSLIATTDVNVVHSTIEVHRCESS